MLHRVINEEGKIIVLIIVLVVAGFLMGAKKPDGSYLMDIPRRVSRLEKRLILLTEDFEELEARVLALENQTGD